MIFIINSFFIQFKCRRQIVGPSGSPNIVTSVCLQRSNYFLERLMLALWFLMAVTFVYQLISFLVTLLHLIIPALGRRYLLGVSKYKKYFDDEDEDDKVENEIWSKAIESGCFQKSFFPVFLLGHLCAIGRKFLELFLNFSFLMF